MCTRYVEVESIATEYREGWLGRGALEDLEKHRDAVDDLEHQLYEKRAQLTHLGTGSRLSVGGSPFYGLFFVGVGEYYPNGSLSVSVVRWSRKLPSSEKIQQHMEQLRSVGKEDELRKLEKSGVTFSFCFDWLLWDSPALGS